MTVTMAEGEAEEEEVVVSGDDLGLTGKVIRGISCFGGGVADIDKVGGLVEECPGWRPPPPAFLVNVSAVRRRSQGGVLDGLANLHLISL